jgi:hypothetical protein
LTCLRRPIDCAGWIAPVVASRGLRDVASIMTGTSDIRPWRRLNEIDPFALSDGYALDVLPSDNEARVLRQLRSGDRILVARDGRGYVWERSPGKLPRYLVEAILGKHWASPPCPDGQLFGTASDGTLNLRGSHALRRHEVER